jgi:uncharacterized protein YcbX
MIVGSLASIWRYPVKSLRGEPLDSVAVDAAGIPGDRSSALFVRSGHAREGKTFRGKEHDRLHLTNDPVEAVRLGAERGVALEHQIGEHFFDDAPISLLLDVWLRELRVHAGYEVQPERFRPNFFVRARPDFGLKEADLADAELLLGAVRLRVRDPIGRCVTTTYDPEGAASDPEVLQFVVRERNGWMGVYCDVLQAGVVRTGDDVVLRASP